MVYEYNGQYYQNEAHARHQYNQELRENRMQNQRSNRDYAYLEDGSIEKCEDCGAFINSHDHCPRCDY